MESRHETTFSAAAENSIRSAKLAYRHSRRPFAPRLCSALLGLLIVSLAVTEGHSTRGADAKDPRQATSSEPSFPASVRAEDPDILEIAKKQPLNIFVNGAPAKYGDPDLAAAVEHLGTLPHPWTVPKIIELYQQECSTWLRKMQNPERRDFPWEGWKEDAKHCGYLATLLAASRDPRAAVALMTTIESSESPGQDKAVNGLVRYFLPDPRYHRLPPKPVSSTNLFWVYEGEINAWWRLNKDAVTSNAAVLQ